MESMVLGGHVYQFPSLCGAAGILSKKYCEKISKTVVCYFPKLDKRVVTWFSRGSLQFRWKIPERNVITFG